MNDWEILSRKAKMYQNMYPAGTRVLLNHMGDDDPFPVEDNMRGTVLYVDDIGCVHCNFDNGRSLGLVPGADSFRKLTAAELTEESEESEIQADNSEEDEGMNMSM